MEELKSYKVDSFLKGSSYTGQFGLLYGLSWVSYCGSIASENELTNVEYFIHCCLLYDHVFSFLTRLTSIKNKKSKHRH